MLIGLKTFAAIAIATLPSYPASARLTKAPTSTVPAATKPLELVGLRIGMPIDEAMAIMTASGFEPHVERNVPSWNGEVAELVAKATGRYAEMSFSGINRVWGRKGGESLHLEIQQSPNGGEVSEVGYNAAAGGRTKQQIRSEVVARYGAPTLSTTPGSALWCSAGDSCASRGRKPHLIYTITETSGDLRLILFPGSEQQDVWRTRLNKAVADGVGSTKPSF